MKSFFKVIAILLLGTFTLSQLSGCISTPDIYWHEDPKGVINFSPEGKSYSTSIETNDVARLQKIVPFPILLPKYFPQRLNSYKFYMVFEPTSTSPNLMIYYYSLANKKEIILSESQLSDFGLALISYPGYLETQAKLNGDTVITIAGIQMLESEDTTYVMPRFNYSWHQDNLGFLGDIYGYDKTAARKIIESIIE